MKTEQEHARERAEDYVRDRGWRHGPLSWEELGALLDSLDRDGEEYLHIDDIVGRIAGVAMSRTARRALAEAFGVAPEALAPRVVA